MRTSYTLMIPSFDTSFNHDLYIDFSAGLFHMIRPSWPSDDANRNRPHLHHEALSERPDWLRGRVFVTPMTLHAVLSWLVTTTSQARYTCCFWASTGLDLGYLLGWKNLIRLFFTGESNSGRRSSG